MTRTYGAVESYQEDELVVDLADRGLVKTALDGLGVTFTADEQSERLGLALLGINLTAAAGSLRKDANLVQHARNAKWPDGAPAGIELSNLDLLLYKLRGDFSSSYGGWIPVIGKNRMIAPVRGFPYVDGCAADDPSLLGFADPISNRADGESLGWKTRAAEPGRGVRVGLLDTRLYPHPWLNGGYLATDLLESPDPVNPPSALDGHGTFVAGLILRQAPGAGLIVHPVLDENALGKTWDVAKAMAEFADTDVDILNLSFGCYTDDAQPPLVLARAVSVVSPQILLVAAAGNCGNIEEQRKDEKDPPAEWTQSLTDTTPVWPAAFPEVTAVGATDGNGELADFSPKAPWVDVVAPGLDVKSTYLNGTVELTSVKGKTQWFTGFAYWDGTSFAAANVTGAVAAKIKPGRDARQALEAVLAHPKSKILPFS